MVRSAVLFLGLPLTATSYRQLKVDRPKDHLENHALPSSSVQCLLPDTVELSKACFILLPSGLKYVGLLDFRIG